MSRVFSVVASALASGAAAATAMADPGPRSGISVTLVLAASAAAFAGLGKTGPELWRSVLPPETTEHLPRLLRDLVRLGCVLVSVALNVLLGLALTWGLNWRFIHRDPTELWWVAVLVCYCIQRTAPPVLDAIAEAVPAWIRRLGGGK